MAGLASPHAWGEPTSAGPTTEATVATQAKEGAAADVEQTVMVRAPGSPPRTAINEPIGLGAATQYFFLHEDNFFGVEARGADPARVKFQFSFRFEVASWNDIHNIAINIAFTQRSFWDLFDWEHSAPFIETDYRPELFVSWRPRRLERFREVQLGVMHESNGLGEVGVVDQTMDSRSWNSVFVEGRWGISRSTSAGEPWVYVTPGLRLWKSFAVSSPELRDAIGWFYGFLDVDLRIPSWPKISRVSARLKVHRHAVEVDAYYPVFALTFPGKVRTWFFAQLFSGQGERLITFDENATHVYAGLAFQ
jgi:phospholipase A1